MTGAVFKAIGAALSGFAAMLPGWLWAIALALMVSAFWIRGNALQASQTELLELRAESAQSEVTRSEIARLAEAGRRADERRYHAELATTTQRTAHEIESLNLRVADLVGSLSKRPQRPATSGGAVPTGGSSPVACTGAGLYREDAAFLVGESARANKLRIQLAECQGRHDAAVALTNAPIPTLPTAPALP